VERTRRIVADKPWLRSSPPVSDFGRRNRRRADRSRPCSIDGKPQRRQLVWGWRIRCMSGPRPAQLRDRQESPTETTLRSRIWGICQARRLAETLTWESHSTLADLCHFFGLTRPIWRGCITSRKGIGSRRVNAEMRPPLVSEIARHRLRTSALSIVSRPFTLSWSFCSLSSNHLAELPEGAGTWRKAPLPPKRERN
jgi:hypothetical protein